MWRFLLFLFFFQHSYFLIGQKVSYDLLYKIQAPDNGVEGFLFGSMHINDPLVFNFPDSLYLGISNCEAFANEVQLDSFMQAYLMKMESDGSFEDIFEDKKAKQDRTDPLTKPVVKLGADKKMSPMDAYLMEMAKRQGKFIYGLESIEETISSMDDAGFMDRNYFENDLHNPYYVRLKNAFADGSLSDLEALFGGETFVDEEIIRRNNIQANSIDRIMQRQSLFAVVGAAHLFGPENVIQLLQEKGFTVEKVKATFNQNLSIDKYPVENSSWYTKLDQASNYSIQFPNKPVPVYMEGLKMLISADIGTGNFYYLTSFPSTPDITLDSLIKIMNVSYQQQGYIVLNEKEVNHVSGFLGKTVALENQSNPLKYLQLMVINAEGTCYLLLLGSMEKESKRNDSADYFFNSLKILKGSLEMKWIEKEDGFYKVLMPESSVPRTMNKEDEDGYIHQLNILQGTLGENTFLVREHNFPNGLQLDKDSVLLHITADALVSAMDAIQDTSIQGEFNGYPSLDVFLRKEYLDIQLKIISRANKTYLLMSVGNADVCASFFDSFSFLPYEDLELKKTKIFNGNITMDIPVEYDSTIVENNIYSITEAELEKRIFGTESNTGSVVLVEELRMSPLLFFANRDSLFEELVIDFLEDENDTIYADTTLLIDGVICREIITTNKNRNSNFRTLFAIKNNLIYTVSTSFPNELLNRPTLDELFYGIKFHIPYDEQLDVFASKEELILEALVSKDSELKAEAKLAISQIYFSASNRKRLNEMILEPDTTIVDSEVRVLLIDELKYENREKEKLSNSSLAILKKLWLETAAPQPVRIATMRALVQDDSATGLSLFFSGLKVEDPIFKAGNNAYHLTDCFTDSINLYFKFWNELIAENRKYNLVGVNYTFATKNIKDSTTQMKLTASMLNTLTVMAPDFFELKDSSYNYYSDQDDIILFLEANEAFEMADTLAAKAFLKRNVPLWFSQRLLKYLYRRNLPVNQQRLKELLDNRDNYIPLLSTILSHDKKQTIPSEYLELERVAKAQLRSRIINYEEGGDPVLNFKEEKFINFKEEEVVVLFYIYQFTDKESNKVIKYPAMVGPFPKDKTIIELPYELVNWEYTELTADNEQAAFEDLIKVTLENY